ncbi:hypothetical protein Bealeia1_00268 [Candidatus Bealeia paramacronuclearis]|uniref:Secreted protein n=1 Tax=Candidatus Bealeia paramacronuclearis TaxID=1921001 RepID=A0ABZ2C1E6_9PROT|nr:hypothetical protein [Candidatus Bealeia paramacronuclearis]
MKSHVSFRALVLGSVFSVSFSFSAFSIGFDEFKNVGIENEWNNAPKTVQERLKGAKDLDSAFESALKIEKVTSDIKHETSQSFLRQILKVETSISCGHQEDQDGEALTGFGNQIEKVFGFYQMSAKVVRDYSDKTKKLSSQEVNQLGQLALWIKRNFSAIESDRKIMARPFFLRRVGYNSHHKEAMETTWNALAKVKKMDLILKTLNDLGNDSEMRQLFEITDQTKPEEIILTRKKLSNLPSYLLEGFSEFQVPENFKYSYQELQNLKFFYDTPFSVLWSGDNDDVSKPNSPVKLGAVQPLQDLGMEIEANRVLSKAFQLEGRQKFINEINYRVLGGLQVNLDKLPEIQKKIKEAESSLRQKWAQHVLGRSLKTNEELPNQPGFNGLLQHVHLVAAMHFVLDNGKLDSESVGYLKKSADVRLAEILVKAKKIYDTALKGNTDAFQEVCSWIKYIDEKNTDLFIKGDREFFDEFEGTNATSEEKLRFEKIITGIYSVMGQLEISNHPEFVTWKLATEDRKTEEITKSLLLRIKGYEDEIQKDWLLSRSPEIKALPLELSPEDQKAVQIWEEASQKLQKEGTQNTDESKKLHKLVWEDHPYEQAQKVLFRHTLTVKIYSILGGIQGILQQTEDDKVILQSLLKSRDLLTQIKEASENKGNLLAQLGDEPHWKLKLEVIQNIWNFTPERYRKAISDIKIYGNQLKPIVAKSQMQNIQVDEKETQPFVDKILEADKILKGPLPEKVSFNGIFANKAATSSYSIHRDFKRSESLVKFWWSKRKTSNFFQNEKRFEDVLLLRQFFDVDAKPDLDPKMKAALLNAIWNASQRKLTLESYLQ